MLCDAFPTTGEHVVPIFIVKAVQRSADGKKSAHVHDKWPVEAETIDEAKAFADATPKEGSGWSNADTFEIVDEHGKTLSCRAMSDPHAWKDEEQESPAAAED